MLSSKEWNWFKCYLAPRESRKSLEWLCSQMSQLTGSRSSTICWSVAMLFSSCWWINFIASIWSSIQRVCVQEIVCSKNCISGWCVIGVNLCLRDICSWNNSLRLWCVTNPLWPTIRFPDQVRKSCRIPCSPSQGRKPRRKYGYRKARSPLTKKIRKKFFGLADASALSLLFMFLSQWPIFRSENQDLHDLINLH